MTISKVDQEVEDLVSKYHVYGIDYLIRTIVRVASDKPFYFDEEYMQVIIKNAFRNIEGGDAYEGPQHN